MFGKVILCLSVERVLLLGVCLCLQSQTLCTISVRLWKNGFWLQGQFITLPFPFFLLRGWLPPKRHNMHVWPKHPLPLVRNVLRFFSLTFLSLFHVFVSLSFSLSLFWSFVISVYIPAIVLVSSYVCLWVFRDLNIKRLVWFSILGNCWLFIIAPQVK